MRHFVTENGWKKLHWRASRAVNHLYFAQWPRLSGWVTLPLASCSWYKHSYSSEQFVAYRWQSRECHIMPITYQLVFVAFLISAIGWIWKISNINTSYCNLDNGKFCNGIFLIYWLINSALLWSTFWYNIVKPR